MNRKFRIEDNELLQQNHYPVKVLFDMVSDERFKRVILGICNNVGFGENYGACVFWDDLDDYDKSKTEFYEGAEFGLNNGEEVIINQKELLYYLDIVCKKYCEDCLEDKQEIIKLLNIYKEKNGTDTQEQIELLDKGHWKE